MEKNQHECDYYMGENVPQGLREAKHCINQLVPKEEQTDYHKEIFNAIDEACKTLEYGKALNPNVGKLKLNKGEVVICEDEKVYSREDMLHALTYGHGKGMQRIPHAKALEDYYKHLD